MHEQPRFFDDLTLVALSSAVSCARTFVHYTLANWQVGPFVLGDALVMTHELVTQAVADTGMDGHYKSWAEVDHLNYLVVRLVGFARHVVIEVWDRATEPAVLPDGEPVQPRSGLALIDAVAHRWASSMTPTGRLTWAEVAVYDRTDSGLPIRPSRSGSPSAPPLATLSDELLRRVHDGLNRL
jgi:hypothetical protein